MALLLPPRPAVRPHVDPSPILGIFIPLAIILLVARTHGNALETRRAAAGLCLAVALGFAVTNFIKNGVGAFRPDFVARCWPDGEITWASHGVPDCRPTRPRDVMEGRKSFPSGHASMSFSGLSYASAYAAARLGVFSTAREGPVVGVGAARAAAAWAPLALAAAVSISRTQDYWHHLEDVAWGGIIGISCAGVAWAQNDPSRRRAAKTRFGTRDKDGDDGFESTRWRPARWVRDGRRPVRVTAKATASVRWTTAIAKSSKSPRDDDAAERRTSNATRIRERRGRCPMR